MLINLPEKRSERADKTHIKFNFEVGEDGSLRNTASMGHRILCETGNNYKNI